MTVLDNRQRSRSRTWVLFFLSLCTTSSSMLSFMRMSKATRAEVRIWGEAGNSVWISGGYRSHGTRRQERLDNRDPQRHRSQYRQPIVASPSILHCQCFVFLFQIQQATHKGHEILIDKLLLDSNPWFGDEVEDQWVLCWNFIGPKTDHCIPLPVRAFVEFCSNCWIYKVVRWNSLSCYMDLAKLIHGFL